MNHILISIEAAETQQEILIGDLTDLNATGFEQTNTHLLVYFEEDNFKSYEVNLFLKEYVFQTSIVKQQNWNEEWERNFEPVIVDQFCAVRAHFHAPVRCVEYEIIITPKMSFGTGHHATTYMMMKQMKNIDFNNKSVFDFGTGTGILAILACKLGATDIIAIDNDEWSINNATENLQQNNCKAVQLQLSSDVPTRQFDIILANINKNVILSSLPLLQKGLKKDGKLLLSGLLVTDEREIDGACARLNLELVEKMVYNNWISLLYKI